MRPEGLANGLARRVARGFARRVAALFWLMAVPGLLLTWGAVPARADDSAAARITKLNKQALDAFDNLNFDQSKSILEQAIHEGEGAGLSKDPLTARSHLNLGMLLIAGFQ